MSSVFDKVYRWVPEEQNLWAEECEHPARRFAVGPFPGYPEVAKVFATFEEGTTERSLADGFAKYGKWTRKQEQFAYRLYFEHRGYEQSVRYFSPHTYQKVASVTHYSSVTLNTYDYTDTYQCEKCGHVYKQNVSKNYSGD